MRLAVLLVFAASAAATSVEARDGSNEPQDKPPYGQTEVPDKQVEYVTGPNVGIVGPTVLGGKGQEVQPSGEELQSTDKEQRDVSSQYSGYQQVSAQQDEAKEQVNEASYPKYSYGEGVKYIQRQEPEAQSENESLQKKNQVIQIGNAQRPTKITYFQSGEPYTQPIPTGQSHYLPQNQELSSAQLLARTRTHQLSQLLNRGPSEYEQVAAQNHGQEERGISQSQSENSDGSTSSAQGTHSSEDHEGQQAPPTNAAPVYIPREYLQYQIAAAQEDLHSTLQSPSKHLLQLFLPQEGTGGQFNIGTHQSQVAPLQSSPNLQPIHNGHQIQYFPAYYTSQSPSSVQKAYHPAPQNPTAQIIRPHQEVSQSDTNIQNAHSSGAIIPPGFQRPQLHPQLYSNFQPSHHQPLSSFSNEPTQYHLPQQSNEAAKRPQKVYLQTKQTAQPAQKPITTKQSNTYIQPHSQPTIYRPKTPERLPQRQPENLALVSQSPPKTTQHRQTHDKPPQLQPQERPQALQSHDRPQVHQPHERPQTAQSHDRPQSFQPHDRPQTAQSHDRPQSFQPHDRPQTAQSHDRPQSFQPHDRPQAAQSHDRPQSFQPYERPQAAQSHDRPQSFQPHERPHTLQSEPVFQTESIQPIDYKLSAAPQHNPYTIQKLQSPLQIQSPTPFPVKVVPLQPQAPIPLTYQLPTDKELAFRPIIYPDATHFGQAVQTETPLSLGLIPTEAAKLYNVKIPSYIKALEQVGHSKPFGFSQMSYGQSPGSYSYSIFNKHS